MVNNYAKFILEVSYCNILDRDTMVNVFAIITKESMSYKLKIKSGAITYCADQKTKEQIIDLFDNVEEWNLNYSTFDDDLFNDLNSMQI